MDPALHLRSRSFGESIIEELIQLKAQIGSNLEVCDDLVRIVKDAQANPGTRLASLLIKASVTPHWCTPNLTALVSSSDVTSNSPARFESFLSEFIVVNEAQECIRLWGRQPGTEFNAMLTLAKVFDHAPFDMVKCMSFPATDSFSSLMQTALNYIVQIPSLDRCTIPQIDSTGIVTPVILLHLYYHLGKYFLAEQHPDIALEMFTKAAFCGLSHAILDPSTMFACMASAQILEDRNELEKAADVLRRGIALLQDYCSAEVSIACNNFGLLLARLGNVAEAEEAYRMGLKLNPQGLNAVKLLFNLGLLLFSLGRNPESESAFMMAEQLSIEFEVDQSVVWTIKHYLGLLTFRLGQFDRAEKLHLENLVQAAPTEHVLETYSALSELYENWGHLEAAEHIYQQHISLLEQVAPTSLSLLHTYLNLSLFQMRTGNVAMQMDVLTKAYTLGELHYPKTAETTDICMMLGNIYFNRNLFQDAKEWYLKAEKAAPDASASAINSLEKLGIVTSALTEDEAAVDYFRTALARLLHPGSSQEASVRLNFGLFLATRNRHQEAEEMLAVALHIFTGINQTSSIQMTLLNLGNVEMSLGLKDSAKNRFKEAILSTGNCMRRNAIVRAAACNGLAEILQSEGNFEAAERAIVLGSREDCKELKTHLRNKLKQCYA